MEQRSCFPLGCNGGILQSMEKGISWEWHFCSSPETSWQCQGRDRGHHLCGEAAQEENSQGATGSSF